MLTKIIPIHAWDKHANKDHIDRDPDPDQPPAKLFNRNSTRENQKNNNQSTDEVLQGIRKNNDHTIVDFSFTTGSRKEVRQEAVRLSLFRIIIWLEIQNLLPSFNTLTEKGEG